MSERSWSGSTATKRASHSIPKTRERMKSGDSFYCHNSRAALRKNQTIAKDSVVKERRKEAKAEGREKKATKKRQLLSPRKERIKE